MTWTTVRIALSGGECGPPPEPGAEGGGTLTVSCGASAPPTGLLVYWSGSPAIAKFTPEIPGTRRGCETSAGPTRLQRATRATRTMPNRLGVICVCSSDSRGNHLAMGGAPAGLQRRETRKTTRDGSPSTAGTIRPEHISRACGFGPSALECCKYNRSVADAGRVDRHSLNFFDRWVYTGLTGGSLGGRAEEHG